MPRHYHKPPEIGETFSRLTVIAEDSPKGTHRRWRCRCSCGNIRLVAAHGLWSGRHKSCGCLRNERIAELCRTDPIRVGETYGRLLVLAEAAARKGKRRWVCLCTCGNTRTVWQELLRCGKTQSCGCLRKEVTRDRSRLDNRKHGLVGTTMYTRWATMLARCYNPKTRGYYRYGGRGIDVCERWKNSVECFVQDLGLPPFKGASLDRIDNDRGYYPDNVRWSNAQEQCFTRSSTIKVTIRGETKPLVVWAALYGMPRLRLYDRLRAGWTPEEAVDTPCHRRSNDTTRSQESRADRHDY